MSEARINTALRFKMSALLALTTSAAVSMASAGPFLTDLSLWHYWLILGLLLLMGLTVAFSTAITIRRRKKISHQCGALVVTLPLTSLRALRIFRWAWVLLFPPLMILPTVFTVAKLKSVPATLGLGPMEILLFTSVMMLFLHSFSWVGKLGVLLWAEGPYCNCVELCEQGIVQLDQLFVWSSPKIKELFIRKLNNDLVYKIKGFPLRSLRVPEEQQELVRSLLETHYQRPKPSSPFDGD